MNKVIDRLFGFLEDILKALRGGGSVHYEIKQRAESVTENKRFNDTLYCSWLAVNIGNVAATVYGIELLPGEGLSSQSIIKTNPGDYWTEPIDITVESGGEIRLLRTLATPKR